MPRSAARWTALLLVFVACASPVPTPPDVSPHATPSVAPGNFPAEVLGLPVQGVSEVARLLRTGRLDGRVVAVGGYWSSPPIPPGAPRGCPAPAPWQWTALLDGDPCGHLPPVVFRDDPAPAAYGDGSAVLPWFMPESSGTAYGWASLRPDEVSPIALVFIGHAADPRMWLCRAPVACALAFVVDHVAWAEDEERPIEPFVLDVDSELTAGEATAAIATAASHDVSGLLSLAAVRGRSVPEIDPRIPLAGASAVWLGTVMTGLADEVGTVAIDHVVVDDATGLEVAAHPVASDPGYEPGRVFLLPDYERGLQDADSAFFAVERPDGETLLEGEQGPSFWGGSMPAVLEPGSYRLRAWYGPVIDSERRRTACSKSVEVHASEVIDLQVRFGRDGCEWRSVDSWF